MKYYFLPRQSVGPSCWSIIRFHLWLMPFYLLFAGGTPLLSLCLSYRVHLLAVDFSLEPLVKLRLWSNGCIARRQKCSRTQVRSAFFPPRALPSNKIHEFFKRLAIFSFSETKLTPGNLMRNILKNFYHTWRPNAILPVSRAR